MNLLDHVLTLPDTGKMVFSIKSILFHPCTETTTPSTTSSFKMRIAYIINEYKSHKKERHYESLRLKARSLRAQDEHWNVMEFESLADQGTWVGKMMELERKYAAIAQRLRRFGVAVVEVEVELIRMRGGRADDEEMEEEEEEDEKFGRVLTSIEKRVLVDTLAKTQETIDEHWEMQPYGNTARAYEIDCRNISPTTGRSVQWEHESRICAENGGCCSRWKKCGCCKKPLGMRKEIVKGQEVDVPVFGHCTGECGCCTKDKGIYLHDGTLHGLQAGQRW
ncbi:hypothetical protein BDV18DRAFT_158461 [Aspergillus unguis]